MGCKAGLPYQELYLFSGSLSGQSRRCLEVLKLHNTIVQVRSEGNVDSFEDRAPPPVKTKARRGAWLPELVADNSLGLKRKPCGADPIDYT